MFSISPKEALKFPVKMFFAMLKEGHKQKEIERNQALYDMTEVQAISIGTWDYYNETRRIRWDKIKRLMGIKEKINQKNNAVPIESDDMQNLMIGVFGARK